MDKSYYCSVCNSVATTRCVKCGKWYCDNCFGEKEVLVKNSFEEKNGKSYPDQYDVKKECDFCSQN